MKTVSTAFKYAIVAFIVLIALIPFYVLLYLALNAPSSHSFRGLFLVPEFHFANFAEAWKGSKIDKSIFNSLVITSGAVALIVLVSSSAGYSIARFRHKANALIFNTLLLCLTIPAIIITVPLYSLMKSIHGINTHWAMILLMAANAMPLSVFLYSSFIRTLPKEVEESAIIDGCTYFTAFWRITFHFVRPVTSAVVILTGLGIWNNYGQAVFFLQKQEMRTVPLAVSMFFQTYGAEWNKMAATALIGLLPAVAVFLVFQKYFIKGIMAGALKG
ncbi:carbohydrate ABC transporter membrane protein 2 (CUT1 family) [Paenibacillus taihuensis]|uniref:Carbohydrate ABC transporter membrane protein 2 (CUT1 family) n=1 Tax=Paenibacillus taihuensis TaxID=1156355 RepID=A0A3D9SC96_9BACL|nr:carbohydrate ABC transporter permease [Paenibacillus taihuensis]REE87401.1 carbohydrate ABC transporter membrane protein 2 (CUT1 family) [Paenibacillus taihuensis]